MNIDSIRMVEENMRLLQWFLDDSGKKINEKD